MVFFSLWNPLLQEIYSNFQTCQSYQESPNFQGKILYSLLWCEKPWLLNISGGLPFALAVFQITAWTKGAQNDGEGKRWTQHTDSHRTICMARISSKKLILLSKAQFDGHFMGNTSTPCLFPIPAKELLFFLLRLCFPQSIWRWSPTDTAGISLQKQCWSIWHLSIDLWFAVLLKYCGVHTKLRNCAVLQLYFGATSRNCQLKLLYISGNTTPTTQFWKNLQKVIRKQTSLRSLR